MKWLIIGTHPHKGIGFTDRQVIMAAQEDGHDIYYVRPQNVDHLKMVLGSVKLDLIYWENVAGWRLWEHLKHLKIPMVNTWYDDPIMRMESLGIINAMKDGASKGVRIFCWDSYWIERLFRDYQIYAELTHLAANKDEFYQTNTACDDKPIFIGSLHSPVKIADEEAKLIEPFSSILEDAKNHMKIAKKMRSWDQLEFYYWNQLGTGDQRLFSELCATDRELQIRFRWCLWAHLKNEVRVRMLKAALEVSPVVMFGDVKNLEHANVHEIRAMIGDTKRDLIFRDTSGLPTSQLATINHYGWIHLQATDPQSVYEGFPYRVFQTMASGKVLLTDTKKNWSQHIAHPHQVRFYQDMDDFKNQLDGLLQSKNTCKEIGREAHQRFLDNHQWIHRVQTFAGVTKRFDINSLFGRDFDPMAAFYEKSPTQEPSH